jgi:hypothetical protein
MVERIVPLLSYLIRGIGGVIVAIVVVVILVIFIR